MHSAVECLSSMGKAWVSSARLQNKSTSLTAKDQNSRQAGHGTSKESWLVCLTLLQQVPCPEDGCPAPVRQQALTEPDLLLSRLLEKGASLGAGLQRRALYSDTTFSPQRMPPIPACPMSPLGMARSSRDSSLEAVLQISLKRPCHLPM